MGILSRFLGRKSGDAVPQNDRYRSISSDPIVSEEQKSANRTSMEAELEEQRARRESAAVQEEA